jgi:hypothetical protein
MGLWRHKPYPPVRISLVHMPHGVFRRVIVLGRVALKFPRPYEFARGMRCNRWEREMWYVWRAKYGWENLCPILFADPFGFFVVMGPI